MEASGATPDFPPDSDLSDLYVEGFSTVWVSDGERTTRYWINATDAPQIEAEIENGLTDDQA